jgi:serine protease Do
MFSSFRRQLGFVAAGLVVAALPLHAVSTIKFMSGAGVEGDILAERADRVVVDLGFTILTIPKDEIDSIRAENAPAPTTDDSGDL